MWPKVTFVMASLVVDNLMHLQTGVGKASRGVGADVAGDESAALASLVCGEAGGDGFLMALLAQLFDGDTGAGGGGEAGPSNNGPQTNITPPNVALMNATSITEFADGVVTSGQGSPATPELAETLRLGDAAKFGDVARFGDVANGGQSLLVAAWRRGGSGTPNVGVPNDGGVMPRALALPAGPSREGGAAGGVSAVGANALPTSMSGVGTSAGGAAVESGQPLAAAGDASASVNAVVVSVGVMSTLGGEIGVVPSSVQARGAHNAGETPAPRLAGGEVSRLGGEVGRLSVDVSDVAGQIATAAGSSRARPLVIRLDPPHLGEVRLTLWSSGSGVEGRLEVSQAHTAAALRGETAAVMGRLAEAGVAMRSLEIALREPVSDGGFERGSDRDSGFRFDGQPSGQPGGGRSQGGQDGPAGSRGGGQDDTADAATRRRGDMETNSGLVDPSGTGVNVWM